MHLTALHDSEDPLRTPSGEIIYEYIGRDEAHGGVTRHSLAHVTIPPSKASSRHYHQELEETYYILSGKGEVTVNGQDMVLRPGQALLIEPGEVHQICNQQEEDLVFLAVCAPAWSAEDHFQVVEDG